AEKNDPPPQYPVADYEKMLSELQEKTKPVEAELEKTSDSQKAAELKDLLKKLDQKQAQVKAMIEDLKNAPEEKK
ncbi:MAG: hypothetical protein MUP19_02395, partial [Candidatus Aminicenantes bacterium]|nr:hypothetical protein [Candidatus Aminicenantes bacterium]